MELLETQKQQIKSLIQEKESHEILITVMAETNNDTQSRTAKNEKDISSLQLQQKEYSKKINDLKTTFDTNYVSKAEFLELQQLIVKQNQSNSRLLNWLFAMTGGSTIVLLCWLWHYTHQ